MKILQEGFFKEGINLIDQSGKSSLKKLLLYSTFGAALDLLGIGIAIPLILSTSFGSFDQIINIFPDAFKPLLTASNIIVSFIIFVVLKTIISTLLIRYRSDVIYQISSSVSSRLINTLIKKPNDFYIYYGSGTASRLGVVECHNFAQSFVNPIVTFVSEGVLLTAIFIFLFTVHPILSSLLGLLFIFMALLYRGLTKDKISHVSQVRANADQARVNLIETLSSLSLESNSDSQQLWLSNKYLEKNNESRYASAEYLFWSNLTRPYLEALLYTIILGLAVFTLSTQLAPSSSGGISSQELILYFVLAAIRSLPSVTRLISAFVSMNFSKAAVLQLEKTFTHLSSSNKVDNSREYIINNAASSLSLTINNYYVELDNGFKQQIDNFNFNGPGLIYIDGPSGCGKTTLINHLSDIRDDFSGKISWDLVNDANEDSKISLCPQEVYLLSGTLEENIYLGKQPNKLEKNFLIDIAKNLDFNKFLNLKDVLSEIQIDNFGLTLSGGQRQRVALLRGIGSRANVVIFDEPLSSLDQKYRSYILTILKKLSETKIIILTSHVDRESILAESDYDLILKKLD